MTIFLICSLTSFSQEDVTKIKFKDRIGVVIAASGSFSYLISATSFYHISSSISLRFKKHIIFFGPSFHCVGYLIPDPYYSDMSFQFEKPINNAGINAGYHFYPSRMEKNVQIFLQYNLQKTFSISDKPTFASIDDQYLYMKINLFENTIGYGIRLNLSEKLYVFHTAGIGFTIMYMGIAEPKNKEKFYESNNLLLPVMIKIGIGIE